MTAYRDHPVHQKFLEWLNERDCAPLAFDYVLDDHTVLMPELTGSTELTAVKGNAAMANTSPDRWGRRQQRARARLAAPV